jgi:hypothetical protein
MNFADCFHESRFEESAITLGKSLQTWWGET